VHSSDKGLKAYISRAPQFVQYAAVGEFSAPHLGHFLVEVFFFTDMGGILIDCDCVSLVGGDGGVFDG